MEFTRQEKRDLLQNSIERVFNTAIRISYDLHLDQKHEDGHINREDLENLKPLVTKLWNEARNSLYDQPYPRPQRKKTK